MFYLTRIGGILAVLRSGRYPILMSGGAKPQDVVGPGLP